VPEEVGAMEQILRMLQQDLATWVSGSILGRNCLRLACAERAEVEVFLTTDDGPLSRAVGTRASCASGQRTRYPGTGSRRNDATGKDERRGF
jgi:hypothetical protein